MQDPNGCLLPAEDPLFEQYHDLEWGIPQNDDQVFFEKVCLEGFQSGLSWRTILHRREALRTAFNHFELRWVAGLTEQHVQRMMQDSELIRNERKIRSVINNAARALELQSRYGSLAAFFWQFEPPVASRPACISRQWLAENPQTPESIALAKTLKKLGWSFVGPVNMYALMQAMGIVNDHVHQCPRRATIDDMRRDFSRPVTNSASG